MGFFDDLDQQVGQPAPAAAPGETDAGALQGILDKLESGWRFDAVVASARADDRDKGKSTEHQTTVWFESGRFVVQTRLLDRRGPGYTEVHDDTTRRLDRQGLIEHLAERPLLGQKLSEAAGVSAASSVDPSGFQSGS